MLIEGIPCILTARNQARTCLRMSKYQSVGGKKICSSMIAWESREAGLRWSHRRNGEPSQAMTSSLISDCESPPLNSHAIVAFMFIEALSSAFVFVGLRLNAFAVSCLLLAVESVGRALG